MADYEAGTCNINQIERKKRLVVGAVSFFNSVILMAVLAFFPELTILYAALFILNFAGFIGLLQYREHFCAGLALTSKFKIGDSERSVESEDEIAEDRRKALLIIIESFIGSSALTILLYLVFTA